ESRQLATVDRLIHVEVFDVHVLLLQRENLDQTRLAEARMSFFVVKPLVTPYKRRIYKECDQCAHARTLTNQSLQPEIIQPFTITRTRSYA
ncbi:MAG: hypothetical protein QP772_05900, partial [Actinomycetaceae bacterium UMB1218B]|nr:hypothetical protein [Actinomycetaceae bacterium UMB1218B]